MKKQSLKLDNTSKILFFITASFPYGKDETFIENEIKFLSNSFDKIIIISHNLDSNEQRKINNNIEVIRRSYSLGFFGKFFAISGIFDKLFWKEIEIIKKTYQIKISIGILKTILISIYNSRRLKKEYEKIILKYSNVNYQNYCYSYWCNDSALALAFIKLNYPKFKSFCRIHGWDVYFHVSPINYLPFRQYIAENLDMIFSISNSGRKYAIDKWRAKSKQIQISRLGVLNNYKIDIVNQGKSFHLVSCSNIITIKRVHLIAEALKMMSNVKLKWTHFGDGAERNILELIIKTLPKSIEVILKGRVSNNEIYSFYNLEMPSLFINVSSSEGVPVSIMEAMSFGIPVIATNVGGNSEIVNKRNGFLLEPNPSPEIVANKIKEYYNLSMEEKIKKSKASFDTWKSKYNAEKNYNQFLDEILSL